MLENSITSSNINIFVVKFYEKVMLDEKIGKFFTDILGKEISNEAWSEHIDLLCDFWESMLIGGSSYRGSPFTPHIGMQGLTDESFKQWLKIFFETLDEIYEKETSLKFKEVGTIMAQNFMKNLGL